MATPPVSSNPEVAEHYAAQVGITAALTAALRRLWPAVDLGDVKATWPDYRRDVLAVTQEYASASIAVSADHYDTMRDQAGIGGRFRTPIADPPVDQLVLGYLDAATEDFLAEHADELARIEADIQAEIDATMGKLVMDAGRGEILTAVKADEKAKGWARVVRPGACSFCLLLATRGAAYKSEKTATFRAHQRFGGKGGDCRCTAEPLFAATYEPSAQVRAAQTLYAEATTGLPRGADRANAFRRAVAAQRAGT